MKLAVPLALALALSAGAAEATPASPAMLARAAPAVSVQTVDYLAFSYGSGPRRRYYAPRYVAPAPRVIVRGPCRTKVVKYKRNGKVVRVNNRC